MVCNFLPNIKCEMTFHILLLFGIGEWIEANPAVTFTIIVVVVSVVAGYVRLESRVNSTRADLNDYMEKTDHHIGNSDAHVNQLYIGTLKERLGKVESSMDDFRKDMTSEFKGIRKEINDGHQKIMDTLAAQRK